MRKTDEPHRPTYSEVVATLGKLGDLGRKFEDTEKLLLRLLEFSQVAPKRAAILAANGIHVVAMHLRNAENSVIQQRTAAILLNLGQSENGRLAIASCHSWSCLSYRHECPLAYLLQVAINTQDIVLKRICMGAVINCSFHAACHAHLDEIHGTPLLLKLLDTNDEDVAVYTAATLWCLCKDRNFIIRLETIYCLPAEGFMRKLSLILWTRCMHFGLALTTSPYSSDATGLLESTGENLDLVFTTAISTNLSLLLQMEHYSVKRAQATVQSAMQYKSVQKFNHDGVLVATTCAKCAKPVKDKHRLSCANDKCNEVYHVRCSRWRRIDLHTIQDNRGGFYCDVCFPKCPLQYLDFAAAEGSAILTKRDFDVLGITHDSENALCMLQAPSLDVIAVGTRKYACTSKHDLAVVHITATVRACVSLCHNNQPPLAMSTQNPWTFECFQTTAASELTLHRLALWPATKAIPIDPNAYLRKSRTELDQATVFECSAGSKNASVFALGSADGHELWSALHPSRAKCMKLVSETLAASKGAPKTRTKPHIQRTLERQPSAGRM
ncbi:hypothetical protein SPRG_01067 [Saprolegnia parasitica CBS 223.65]|uniref:Zinc finger PHD-type domain-containing protein n=1 Tax=Saprolegnia parasitica (strain CBS 223.65) TaxID=695850 RepID=A0A067CWB9_SAPPC|nr:hypothetical protein SPRG_01067 [Saprolegnia parasitica CBS 223.65]KDO35004.1 hypothetical protein SPRG_01067 [Saprolegnia parasitica CBS 223.65]|eukprot:XP_012194657.1 hypothetical protein SPRG_01067 [Saprolegnia parasitica CBS 223.65]